MQKIAYIYVNVFSSAYRLFNFKLPITQQNYVCSNYVIEDFLQQFSKIVFDCFLFIFLFLYYVQCNVSLISEILHFIILQKRHAVCFIILAFIVPKHLCSLRTSGLSCSKVT